MPPPTLANTARRAKPPLQTLGTPANQNGRRAPAQTSDGETAGRRARSNAHRGREHPCQVDRPPQDLPPADDPQRKEAHQWPPPMSLLIATDIAAVWAWWPGRMLYGGCGRRRPKDLKDNLFCIFSYNSMERSTKTVSAERLRWRRG